MGATKSNFFQLALSFLLLLVTVSAIGQGEVIRIKSDDILRDSKTNAKLDGVQIVVFKNGAQQEVQDAGTKGKFDFTLPLGYTYELKFSKSDYVTKILRIDTRNIPPADRAGGFTLEMSVTLFAYIEGFNTDIMKDPMSKASFVSQTNTISQDDSYTETMQGKIDAEFKRLEDVAKNGDRMKKEFDKFIAEGDAKMTTTRYEEAMQKYQSALNIFPTDATAKSKYNEAEKKWKEQLNAQNSSQEFAKLIKEADELFKNKKWDEAKGKYSTASNLKTGEKYPRDQMYLCDQELKKEDANRQYAEFIQEADSRFNSTNYEAAISSYKKALNIRPNEVYPKSQIDAANAALLAQANDKEKQKEIEERYKALVASGDELFSSKKYQLAIAKYESALEIKPNQSYPQTQINKAKKELDAPVVINRPNNSGGSGYTAPQNATVYSGENEWKERLLAQEKEMEEIRRKREDELAEQARLQAEKRLEEENLRNGQNHSGNNHFNSSVDLAAEKAVDEFYENSRRISQEKKILEIEAEYDLQSNEVSEKQRNHTDSLIFAKELLANSSRESIDMHEMKVQSSSSARIEELETIRRNQEEQNTVVSDQQLSRLDDVQRSNTQTDLTRSEAENKVQFSSGEVIRNQSAQHDRQEEALLDSESKNKERLDEAYANARNYTASMEEGFANDQERVNGRANQEYVDPYHTEKQERFKDRNEYLINQQSYSQENGTFEGQKPKLREQPQYLDPNSPEYQAMIESRLIPLAGTENLPDGITERSYEGSGNSQTIERILKKGNKVDIYQKTVSRGSTYFSKNGRAITEDMWNSETTSFKP
ncbi:MAG: hypothetical protein FJX90_05585 [Bacteroidetes bacterium]|nr:hypothetical protein [Bacteroidota bacterium]